MIMRAHLCCLSRGATSCVYVGAGRAKARASPKSATLSCPVCLRYARCSLRTTLQTFTKRVQSTFERKPPHNARTRVVYEKILRFQISVKHSVGVAVGEGVD